MICGWGSCKGGHVQQFLLPEAEGNAKSPNSHAGSPELLVRQNFLQIISPVADLKV